MFESQESTRERLSETIAKFDTVMLVTNGENNEPHIRPMRVMKKPNDEALWFVSAKHSSKIDEILADRAVYICAQSGSLFCTARGRAEAHSDPTTIDSLWSDSMRTWFPKGKEDPELCFIRFDLDSGEYWDISGFNWIKYVTSATSAYLAGRTPNVDSPSVHGKTNPL